MTAGYYPFVEVGLLVDEKMAFVDAMDNGVKHKLAAWPFRAFVIERATRRFAYISTMNDAEFDVMTLYDFFN